MERRPFSALPRLAAAPPVDECDGVSPRAPGAPFRRTRPSVINVGAIRPVCTSGNNFPSSPFPRRHAERLRGSIMDSRQLDWIANFIWDIADDVLRDLYVRGKYRD